MKFVMVIGNMIFLSFFLFKYFLQVSVFLLGHTVESDGAGLLVRGGSVRHDRQEAAADGAPQPHLHQWNVPPLLHHRRCHGSPRNILLIQTLQRKVITVLLWHSQFFSILPFSHFFQYQFLPSIFLLCSELGGTEEAHVHNCVVFCSVWALWNPHRMLFHLAILFTRQLLLNILNKAGHFTGLDSCMFDTRPVS